MASNIDYRKKLSEDSLKIKLFIRNQLSLQKITYAEVAKELEVSVPTIKRWMTKDDFPFEALAGILKMINVSFKDLFNKVEQNEIKKVTLKESHEAYITSHPQEAFIFLLLFIGYDSEQIRKKLYLSEGELEKFLISLDRNNLIIYSDQKVARTLIRPPFKWADDGKFSKKYLRAALDAFTAEIFESAKGFSPTFKPLEAWTQIGEMYMTQKTLIRMKLDFQELLDKYREMARVENSFKAKEDLFPVTFLLAIDQFPLWQKLMWDRYRKN